MRSLSEEDYKEIARYKDPSDFSTLSDTMYQFIEDQKLLSDAIDEEINTPTLGDMRCATKEIPRQGAEVPADTANRMRTDEFDAIAGETRIDIPTPQVAAFDVASQTRVDIPTPRATFTNTGATRVDIPTPQASFTNTGSTRVDIPTPQGQNLSNTGKTRVNMPAVKKTPFTDSTRVDTPAQKKKGRHYTEYTSVALTPRGKKFFIGGAVLFSPVILLAALLFYGIFAICLASVAAIIVAIFVILALLVIVGSLACLVGIIYGIIQIFSSIGIGLYEIGVGIIASGVTVVVSVLLYYLATVAMPYLMRQLVAFFKYFMSRVPLSVERLKERCNRL